MAITQFKNLSFIRSEAGINNPDTQKLGKNPEDYPNAKSEPQVQVARRMKARGEPVRINDVIAYVITGDGQDYNKNVAERAYSPQDVSKSDSDLKIGNIFRRKYG